MDVRRLVDSPPGPIPVPPARPGPALNDSRPPAVEVREAHPEELEETGQVTELAYREFAPPGDEDWAGYLLRLRDAPERAKRALVLVAVQDDRILGTATLELEQRIEPEDDPALRPEEAHIRMVGVLPEARGRGIGQMLMDTCLREAGAAGKTLVTLHTTRRMKAAQRMYESMGFQRGPDRVFDDGFVLLSYSLELGQ